MTRVGRGSWCVAIVTACLALASDQRSSAQAPFDPSQYPALADNPKFQRQLWEFQQRAHGLGMIPADAKERALATIAQMAGAPFTVTAPAQVAVPTSGIWQNVGPAPITSGAATFSGRLTAIAVDPSDSNHWLVGGAQGGVWETTDSGTSWTPRTDSQASLAMGALAFSASNPDIVYAGTGEGHFSGDSYGGGGLLKSIDGGTTWSLLAAATFAKTGFNSIRVDPSDANVLVAATSRGIAGKLASFIPSMPPRGLFRSTDGGTTWSLRRSGEATDLVVNPVNFSQQYGAIGDPFRSAANGVYRSIDGGQTWTTIAGPWSGLAGGVGRVALAVAPSNPNVVYVSIQDAFDSPPQANDARLLGLWVSSDAWAATPTWTSIDATPATGYCSSQCWYDHVLSVDPTNPSMLYAGGVGLWKFNGTTWTNVTTGIHVDQHAMAWVGSRFIVGNDGGVFSTVNGGTSWTSHNTNLAITQFYAGSLHPSDGNFALGGTQDNGTDKWTGGASWPLVFGGDGGYSAFSSGAPNTNWAVTTQNLGIWRTTNGAGFSAADAGITKSGAIFIAPIAKCPSSDDTIVAAAAALWKTTNFFTSAPSTPTWSANSPSFGGSISAIAFAPSDATCNTYAIGTSTGLMRLTTNGGATWADVDPLNAVPNRPIASLAFHPLDPNLLYAAVSGFDEATPSQPGHVFTTSNALASTPGWSNISPPVNLPANSVAASSSQPAGLYVGSDIGVWTSANGGSAWTFLGPAQGMPNVAVFDVKIDETTGRVMAFTHGRGAFVLNAPAPETISITPSSGSGSSQTFSAVYSDTLGASDLAQVFVRFSADLSSPAGSCIVRYTQSTHLLSLRDDAGAWQPGLPLPGGGVLQNSQCAVDVGGSSVSTAGNTLTLNVAMTFTLSYGGLKNTYLNAVSALGPGTGFVLRGTWTVPSAAIDAISVSPSAGSGITQLFTLAYSDSAGVAADLKRAMVRFGASTLNACVVDYNAITATVRLFDDSGVPGSPGTFGNPGTLANSQCSLDLAMSSATPNGNDLTLALKITFLPAFAGPATISMRAQSVSGPNTGWVPKGSWTVGAILGAVSITPNSGTGATRTFSAVFTDSLGVTTDLRVARVRFGFSTVSACVLDYNAMTNQVRLLDDAGVAPPFGPFSGTLANSQCAIDLTQSTATPNGAMLTLDLRITFKAPFLGLKPISLRANGNFGAATTGWWLRGSWNVNADVHAISVTPSNSSSTAGVAQDFALAFSDAEGVTADLKAARVRFRDPSGPQCLVDYNAMTGLVRMQDDAGIFGPFVPLGSGAPLANSQCTLDVAASSAAPSGTNLTLTLRITFKPAFAGTKSIDMRANSNVGSTTNWENKGTWMVVGSVTLSVAPSSGAGRSQKFAMIYTHTIDRSKLHELYVRFGASNVGPGTCTVRYGTYGSMELLNDAGTAWTPVIFGGTLSNSQCSLSYSGQALYTAGPNNTALVLDITFSPTFAGAKNIYLSADDIVSTSPWKQHGTWTVTNRNEDDVFDASALNRGKWTDISHNGQIAQNGELAASPNGTASDSKAAIFTQYRYLGDFDIQVDWRLGNGWTDPIDPGLPTAHLDLPFVVYEDDSRYVQIARTKNSGGDAIGIYTNIPGQESHNNVSVPTSATSGRYRLQRSGNTLLAYYDSGGSWQLLDSLQAFSAPAHVFLGAQSVGVDRAFTAFFDNFRVSAGVTSYRAYARPPEVSVPPRCCVIVGETTADYLANRIWWQAWQQKNPLVVLGQHGIQMIRAGLVTGSSQYLQNTPVAQWGSLPWRNEYWGSREYTRELMQEATTLGRERTLLLYLSDIAADVSVQQAPPQWANLSVADTAAALDAYAFDTLKYFRDADLYMQVYDIGNEIDFGILNFRPNERIPLPPGIDVTTNIRWMRDNVWNVEATLLSAAIAGIKRAQPSAKITLHIAGLSVGRSNLFAEGFFQAMVDFGVPFDYAGVSLPSASSPWDLDQYSTDAWFTRLQELSDFIGGLGKKLIFSEGAYPASAAGQVANPMPEFPFSNAGQASWVRELLRFISPNFNVQGWYYQYPDVYPGIANGKYPAAITSAGLFDSETQTRPALEEYLNITPQ